LFGFLLPLVRTSRAAGTNAAGDVAALALAKGVGVVVVGERVRGLGARGEEGRGGRGAQVSLQGVVAGILVEVTGLFQHIFLVSKIFFLLCGFEVLRCFISPLFHYVRE
jgi:hypothetical protein